MYEFQWLNFNLKALHALLSFNELVILVDICLRMNPFVNDQTKQREAVVCNQLISPCSFVCLQKQLR